jgi:hypothetical protein
MTSEVEQFRKKKYNQKNHKTLEEGVKKKKTRGNSEIGKGGGYYNTKRRNIQNTTSINKTIN